MVREHVGGLMHEASHNLNFNPFSAIQWGLVDDFSNETATWSLFIHYFVWELNGKWEGPQCLLNKFQFVLKQA